MASRIGSSALGAHSGHGGAARPEETPKYIVESKSPAMRAAGFHRISLRMPE
jgi:hypothetical protein